MTRSRMKVKVLRRTRNGVFYAEEKYLIPSEKFKRAKQNGFGNVTREARPHQQQFVSLPDGRVVRILAKFLK